MPNAASTIPKLVATKQSVAGTAAPSESASTRPEKPYDTAVIALREARTVPVFGCRRSCFTCAAISSRAWVQFMEGNERRERER